MVDLLLEVDEEMYSPYVTYEGVKVLYAIRHPACSKIYEKRDYTARVQCWHANESMTATFVGAYRMRFFWDHIWHSSPHQHPFFHQNSLSFYTPVKSTLVRASPGNPVLVSLSFCTPLKSSLVRSSSGTTVTSVRLFRLLTSGKEMNTIDHFRWHGEASGSQSVEHMFGGQAEKVTASLPGHFRLA
jgi:hypothetical protein